MPGTVRLKEFPNNHFAVVSQNLQCNACNEIISKKKSSIVKHVESKKHKKGLADIAKNKMENQTIMACLERRNNRENNAGSTLPAAMQIFRFEIVESFLSIPLAKVDALRPLLEKHGHRLTSRCHMNELIPAVLEKEKNKLKDEPQGVKQVSVIFDGTARLGEAFAIIIRYVQDDFKPTQRLVR